MNRDRREEVEEVLTAFNVNLFASLFNAFLCLCDF